MRSHLKLLLQHQNPESLRWNGQHLEAAATGTSGELRKVVLYIPPYPPLPFWAEKLTFIALTRTYNMRVSKGTVREQHV